MSYANVEIDFGGLSGSKRIDNKNRKFYEIRQSRLVENDIIFTLPDEQKVKMPTSEAYKRIYDDFNQLCHGFKNSISAVDTDLTQVNSNIFLFGGILKIR